MPSPTDRNLTAAADRKPVKPTRRRQTRHFTQLDQVTQLVAARDADPDLGFMARLLALCSLPRTNPKNRHEFKRVNGPYTLYMVAGGGNKLPYGTLPRLLLAWVCTEAVRTQSPELILGDSLSEFMRKVGIYSTSGDKHTRLRNQMRRLFGCTVSLLYEDARGEATLNAPIARLTEFWWSERQPDARSLWESKIELGEDFFNEIIRCPIPIDMNTLRAMKRSPLGLDLYLWLTYRTFALKSPLRLTWRQLYRQFGADPATASKVAQQAFRRDCLRELKKMVPLRDRCSFGRFPWLISQALSVTYMAGERRLYLERNCRLPESPAHSRRRNREGPASSKGLNSQRGFGPAVEPRRKSRPRSTSLHGSSPCKCQRLSTLRWDRLPPSRPSTKSGARAGGRRLSDRRLHRWLAGTSASAPSSKAPPVFLDTD